MSLLIQDIQNLYQRYFGSKPHIGIVEYDTTDAAGGKTKIQANYLSSQPIAAGGSVEKLVKFNTTNEKVRFTKKGYVLLENVKNVEIWLPTKFYNLPFKGINGSYELHLPYSIVSIQGKTNIVKTTVSERKGTVKELYNIDDYIINVKGFLIDKETRVWPEDDIYLLKQLHESGEAFNIDNALVSPFLEDKGMVDTEQQKVVITAFSMPEVEGGKKHVRPFSITLESDSIFTLEYKENV